MNRTLSVRHTVDRHGKPLVEIDCLAARNSIQGDFYPAELRALARQLITIANDAEQGMRGQATYPTPD